MGHCLLISRFKRKRNIVCISKTHGLHVYAAFVLKLGIDLFHPTMLITAAGNNAYRFWA